MALRSLGDDNDEFKEIAEFGIHAGYPYTYPFYYDGEATPRNLGSHDSKNFPYTYPLTYATEEGSRELSDVE